MGMFLFIFSVPLFHNLNNKSSLKLENVKWKLWALHCGWGLSRTNGAVVGCTTALRETRREYKIYNLRWYSLSSKTFKCLFEQTKWGHPEIGFVIDLCVIIISLSFFRSLPENIVIPRSITVIHHGQTDLSCSVQWKVIHFPISTKLMASNSNIEDNPTNYVYFVITLSHPHLHKQNKTRKHPDEVTSIISTFAFKPSLCNISTICFQNKKCWSSENWILNENSCGKLKIPFDIQKNGKLILSR